MAIDQWKVKKDQHAGLYYFALKVTMLFTYFNPGNNIGIQFDPTKFSNSLRNSVEYSGKKYLILVAPTGDVETRFDGQIIFGVDHTHTESSTKVF